jgi:hypothetical protein
MQMGTVSMVDEHKDEEPLVVRLWGIPIDRAISIIQTVGVPLLFMLFVLYLVWSYLPPVANAHIELLQRTGDTLEKMEGTLKDYNKTIEEFSKLGKETSAFMQTATESHKVQLEKLTRVESALIKGGADGNK